MFDLCNNCEFKPEKELAEQSFKPQAAVYKVNKRLE
jgi:hypothetical protein